MRPISVKRSSGCQNPLDGWVHKMQHGLGDVNCDDASLLFMESQGASRFQESIGRRAAGETGLKQEAYPRADCGQRVESPLLAS